MGITPPISPWGPASDLPSPDGKLIITFGECGEIAMGGPISGTIILPGGQRVEGCSFSVVWSDDSHCIAIPCWTEHRAQRLLILDVQARRFCIAGDIYRVLELHSFRDGVVYGIDSPIHNPASVQVDTGTLHWREGFGYRIDEEPVQAGTDTTTKGCCVGIVLAAAGVIVLLVVLFVSG